MTRLHRKDVPAWLIAVVIMGAVASMTSCRTPGNGGGQTGPQDTATTKAMDFIACFESGNIEDMGATKNVESIRFYVATTGKGNLSVIATPVDGKGAHLPIKEGQDTLLLFKEVIGDRGSYEPLDRATAIRRVDEVKALFDLEAWSVDVSPSVLQQILAVKEAGAVGFREAGLSNGEWTFELVPVKLGNNSAVAVGSRRDIRIAALPCPSNCPYPGEYLHQ